LDVGRKLVDFIVAQAELAESVESKKVLGGREKEGKSLL
jgi:hypothetical protein